MTRYDAVEDAVDFAIEEDLLDGFFKKQRMEVLNMSLTEFDQEEYDRNRRREGREEGIAIGAHEKAVEAAKNMLQDNIPIEKIVLYTGLAPEKIKSLTL